MSKDQTNRQTLRKSLVQLRAEMNRLEFRDSKSKHKLEQLIVSMERYADTGTDHPALPQGDFLKGVSDAVAYFEAEHPTLTASLRQIISTLSTMGI